MAHDRTSSASYDYVVIGGGTAGLVVAARLTEYPNNRVVVLEAGQHRPDDPKINIPGFMNTLYGDEPYDWSFHTAPQSHLHNRTIAWPQGKVLGGSSAINFLMHSHASKTDIDNWEKLGNSDWNFDTLAPYYRKSETLNAPDAETGTALNLKYVAKELHGTDGPLQTSFPRGTGPVDSAWSKAFEELGLGVNQDPRNSNTLGGYSLLKQMDQNAKRSYAASAYYQPAAGRKNLTIVEGAMVERIEFKESEGVPVATGVKYLVDGEMKSVSATKEVILCAGTVMSPKILELSGIGSKALLEKNGIDLVVENEGVGENLQDHPLIGLSFQVKDGIPTAEMLKQPDVLSWALKEYAEKGAGPLATGVSGTSFLSHASVFKYTDPEAPDDSLKTIVGQQAHPGNAGLAKQLAIQEQVLLNPKEADLQINFGATGVNPDAADDIAKLFDHNDKGGYAGLVPVMTHAFSRGSVHIQSTDPLIYPLINPNYLSHPVDLEVMASGLMFTQTLAKTQPLAGLLKDNQEGTAKQIQPSFGFQGPLSREMAKEIIRQGVMSSWHPVGSCSMLPMEDGGVVDSKLKVYGTKWLRVVDASVIPLNVRGNISSTVYAVAERAADLIKAD